MNQIDARGYSCPEPVLMTKKALEQGRISPNSTVVSIVTGNGLKDVANGIRAAGEPVVVKPDMGELRKAFPELP